MTEKKEIVLIMNSVKLTLIQVLEKIANTHPKAHSIICTSENKINPGIICVLNNELVIASELESKYLNNNDEIVFSIAIAGG